ncbi:MAG: tetratricopeptide repeat protein [Desulfuromonadales bacterium]|nr:tetratricopeptide repeat protein [Desulfuromonadales bacterium]
MKKQILQEELRRKRIKSPLYRLSVIFIPLCLLILVGTVWYYYATLDQRLSGTFNRAEALILEGEYNGAIELYRRIYEKHPNFELAAKALYRSGEVQNLFINQYHDALLSFLRLEKDYPDSPYVLSALEQEADIYKNRLRDYGRAAALYQKLVDREREPADRFLYELADCYFRVNNFEQARIEFENLLKAWPKSGYVTEVRYRIGVAYSLEGDLLAAEEVFRQVIKDLPEDQFATEARFSLAAVLEEQERLMESLKILVELDNIYPNPEALERKKSQVEERIKNKKRAI